MHEKIVIFHVQTDLRQQRQNELVVEAVGFVGDSHEFHEIHDGQKGLKKPELVLDIRPVCGRVGDDLLHKVPQRIHRELVVEVDFIAIFVDDFREFRHHRV